jgi:hypothetical protein
MKKRAFLMGALVGAALAFLMPDNWSNLAFFPWYVSWFIVPAFLIYGGIAFAFHIDIISDAANLILVSALWAFSVALVLAVYAVIVQAVITYVQRKRHRYEAQES